MTPSDIVAKLLELGIEADEALVNDCIAKGWVLNSDAAVLELAQSLEQNAAPVKGKGKKGGSLAKAGESKPATTTPDELAAPEEDYTGGGSNNPPRTMGEALSHAARTTDQVIAVMETELRAGADRYARQQGKALASIVKNVPDKVEEVFIEEVGGIDSRIGSFRSKFQGHAASIFG